MKQMQHQNQRRVNKKRRSTNFGGSNQVVDIVSNHVVWNELGLQHGMEQGTSRTAGRRKTDRAHCNLPDLAPESSESSIFGARLVGAAGL